MKAVILVRHGQSEVNLANMLTDDVGMGPLSQAGRQQAYAVAKELKRLPKVDAIFTSPVLRAGQTADIIGENLGIRPRVTYRIKERGMGSLDNKRFGSPEELDRAVIAEVKSNYSHGMESWGSLKTRMRGFMQELGHGGTWVAVTHRDPIAATLGIISAEYDDDTISGYALKIPHASITAVDSEAMRIIAIGSSKLPGELSGAHAEKKMGG